QTKDKPIEQSVKIQDERINYVDIQPTIVTNNVIKTSDKIDDIDQVKIKSNPVIMDNQKMTDRADELKEQEVNVLIDKPNESQSENTETQTKDKPIEQIANTDNNKIFISYNKTNQNEQVITKNNDSKHKLFNYTEIATQNIDNDNFEIPLRLDLQQREDIKLSVDKPQSPTNTNPNTMSETFKELNISSINYYKPNNIKNERINDKTDNSIIDLNIQQLDTNSKQNVKPNITLGNIQTIKFLADQRQGKTAFVAETIPRIENKLENITTTSSDNKENGKANPEAFFKNIETPTQKIVNEPVFMVQKIDNGTVQKDVDIKSKILELPEKVVEYIKTIKSYNDLKPHSVVIHLDPPNLGKIRLKVMMNNNNIRAEMNIANSITKEMIEAQLPEIRKGLMQHNIQLSEFNVMLDNNNPRHNQSLSQQEKWSTQTWLYDRNNGNKGNEEQKRRYMRFINNNSLVDLLT
ncbi:TPA: flagellar hook-length control protein FliK, partial [Candidatus Poribacteria bacterium]|nr:flagellar hook-length control protein FliK [Candidatus Poribacteria bacterium]